MKIPRPAARGRAGAVIPARLDIESVSLERSGQVILDNVSISLRESEVLGLVGPSGCGKTTLLRIAGGLDAPDSGKILIDGKAVTGGAEFVPPERRAIGMVFQDYALFPHLTAIGNVMFGLKTLDAALSRRIAMAALARVGLTHKADAYPDILSGGEQQRVALARAIVPRPRVLLMDEPFSNLDREMRDSIRDDTTDVLREMGVTAIIVTHDAEEAMRLTDRIVLMRQGRVAQIGTAREIYRNPVDIEAARFFCQVNELEAVARGGAVSTLLGTFPAPGMRDGSCIVAIRPEGLSLNPGGNGLPVRLLRRRFLGAVEAAEVAVMGIDKPLRLRGRLPDELAQGTEARLAIAPGDVLVFPAS